MKWQPHEAGARRRHSPEHHSTTGSNPASQAASQPLTEMLCKYRQETPPFPQAARALSDAGLWGRPGVLPVTRAAACTCTLVVGCKAAALHAHREETNGKHRSLTAEHLTGQCPRGKPLGTGEPHAQ